MKYIADTAGGLRHEVEYDVLIASQRPPRTALRVNNTFPAPLLAAANEAINGMETHPYRVNDQKGNCIQSVRAGLTSGLFVPVRFDPNGKMVDSRVDLRLYLDKSPPAVKALFYWGIEVFAHIAGIRNQTVSIHPYILRYPLDLSQPVMFNFPWHKDQGTLTMTSLLTPSMSGNVGFTGGEMGFGEGDMDHPYKNIETHPYPAEGNGGFMFDNIFSCHKVNDFILKRTRADDPPRYERRLFSIFSELPRSQVLSFPTTIEARKASGLNI